MNKVVVHMPALVLICSLAVLSACGPDASDDEFQVALEFSVGDQYVAEYLEQFKHQQVVLQEDGSSGDPAGFSSERRVGSHLSILGCGPEGSEIRARYTSVGLRATATPPIDGEPILDFFHSETDGQAEGKLLKDLSAVALLGVAVDFTMDPRGQGSEAPPLLSLVHNHLLDTQSAIRTNEASNLILSNLDKLMDGDYSIPCLSALWPVFPRTEIRRGSFWVQKLDLEGTWVVTFTVSEVGDDEVHLKVSGAAIEAPPNPELDSLQILRSSLAGTVKYTLRGAVEVDAEFKFHYTTQSLVDSFVIQRESEVTRLFRLRRE